MKKTIIGVIKGDTRSLDYISQAEFQVRSIKQPLTCRVPHRNRTSYSMLVAFPVLVWALDPKPSTPNPSEVQCAALVMLMGFWLPYELTLRPCSVKSVPELPSIQSSYMYICIYTSPQNPKQKPHTHNYYNTQPRTTPNPTSPFTIIPNPKYRIIRYLGPQGLVLQLSRLYLCHLSDLLGHFLHVELLPMLKLFQGSE